MENPSWLNSWVLECIDYILTTVRLNFHDFDSLEGVG